MSGARLAAALAFALPLLAACGKSEAPPADPAAERAAAMERAKQGPYGTQLKALENAKGMQADLNKKAQDEVERAEK